MNVLHNLNHILFYILQWTRPSASCGPCNRLDIWYIFVLVLCIFIIVAFVVLQYRYDVTEQIETTVIFASIYVLCGMIIMMKVRYFWTWFVQRSSFWGNWKSLNEEWKIIEAGETDVVTPESPVWRRSFWSPASTINFLLVLTIDLSQDRDKILFINMYLFKLFTVNDNNNIDLYSAIS